MGQPVDANGRSILHKGHGMTHTCAVPDVCKTPSPGGPIPIPYVNVAMDSNITDGAESVKIEGNPVANVSSKIATSMGDEPGTAGGIISGKVKGTVTWKMGSLDVKAEGKSVVRFLDTDFHNGNSFNTSFISPGTTGLAYADDFEEPCPICRKDADKHKILETRNSAKTCAQIVKDLKAGFDAGPKDDFAKERYDSSWGGYMVGVMVCKHDPGQLFAAMSGTYILPGFKRVAEANGCTVVGGGGVGKGGKLRALDLMAANTSGATASARFNAVRAAWQRTAARAGRRPPVAGYSPMGICAGAHLVAKSGHGPIEMTEMFFAPVGQWPKTYQFRVDGTRRPARFGTNVANTPATPWGQTVGSCHTCQDLLFLTMCPERTCK